MHNTSLDRFSLACRKLHGDEAYAQAREGLADVISIHELLTNQIKLSEFS